MLATMSHESRSVKIISYLTPWTCFFSIYSSGLPGVHLGYVLLIILSFVALTNSSGKRFPYSNGYLVVFYLFCVMMLPLSLLLSDSIILLQIANRVLKLLLIIFYVCHVFPSHLNIDYFLKSYRIMAYIFAFILLLQYGSYLLLGTTFSVKIPFLDYVNEWSNEVDFASQMAYTGRMTSVFLEPSHYCYFIIPIIVACLFFEETKIIRKKYLEAAFFSLTVLISAASSGVVVTAFVWCAYLMFVVFSKKSGTTKIVAFTYSIIAIGIGVYLLNNNSTVSFSIERLMPSYSNSENVWNKISGGKQLFDDLPFISKIIGNGLGNMQSIFTTGYYYTLINCGIIGSVLLLLWMTISFFQTNNMGKIMIVVFGLLMMVNMVLYNTNFILMAAFIPMKKKSSRKGKVLET